MQAPHSLIMRGIRKEYPGVVALDGVDFEVHSGEVHALVGVNGAGKSTLINVLAGATRMDKGEIYWDNGRIDIASPQKALKLGISVIYQELNLVHHLSVAENIFLGSEPRNALGFVNWRAVYKGAEAALRRLGAPIDPKAKVETLSVAQQQLVEIAKALSHEVNIIAMDEPTATLSFHETKNLFNIINLLKQQSKGVIYISHRMEEIFQIADRVTVLRDGRRVGSAKIGEITKDMLVEMILGRKLEKGVTPAAPALEGREVLRVEGLTREGILDDINLSVREGEILCVAGLVGAGKTELARAVMGVDHIDSGRIYLMGRPVKFRSPQQAIRAGVVLVPEDRKGLGLLMNLAVRENTSLASLERLSRWSFVRLGQEAKAVKGLVADLRVKTPGIEERVRNLSGGNQQKVVLAKWLLRGAKVFIMDEPTRGIDVGAKTEIYELINRLVQKGIAVIMISSELSEILTLSTRILVMYSGKVVGKLSREEATAEKILYLAMGGR